MDVVFINQESIHSNYKGVFLSHFRVLDNSLNKPDEEIMIEFIKNKTFNIESVPEIAKDRNREGFSEVGYLKPYFLLPLFKYSLLKIEHFRQWNKSELYTFLDNYLINKGWGDHEINDLEVTVTWLKKDIDRCISDRFFVISMDWFDKTDEIINQFESGIYGYFITVLWIDRENWLISCCELIAD